ncbi:MAG: hypothetical protein ACYCXG_04635 [Acidiferrobacter sp.]
MPTRWRFLSIGNWHRLNPLNLYWPYFLPMMIEARGVTPQVYPYTTIMTVSHPTGAPSSHRHDIVTINRDNDGAEPRIKAQYKRVKTIFTTIMGLPDPACRIYRPRLVFYHLWIRKY